MSISACWSLQPFEKEYLRKDGSRIPVLIGVATFEEGGNQGVAFVLDLTTRKCAEQALRESETKLRDYAETASDWFWEIGPDYKFTLLTENAFGSDSAARIGTTCWDHALDLETEPEKWRLVQATLDSREPFRDFVYCSARRDGSPMYVRASGKPVFDASGEFRGYRGTGADVTAIVRAQEALRESERSLRSAIDGIAGLVAVMAPNGELDALNRQVIEYFGRSLEEMKNWGTSDAVHPEDLPRIAESFQKSIAAGTPFHYEVRLRRFDGEYRWFDNRCVPIRETSGRIVRWYMLGTDIEDRKCAEAALRGSEAKFRDYAESASDWYWETDPDHKFARVTDYERLRARGFSPVSRIGLARWEFATDVESEPEKWRLHRSVLEARQPFRDFVYPAVRTDGSLVYYKTSGKPVFDASGEFRGYRGTGTDVTAIVRTQHAEASLRRELQRSQFYLSEGQRLAHMGSFAFDPSGFIDHWSDAMFQIYGMDPQNGNPTIEQVLALVHPEDRDFVAETIKRMLTQGCGCDVKKRIIRPDGELRYIRCVGIPVVEDEVLKGFLGTAIDITEQERLTQRLERRQAHLAEAQKLTQTGSFVWDIATGEAPYLSDQWYSIYGFEGGDAHAWKDRLQRLHADDRSKWDAAVDRAMAERSDYDLEKRIILPDGTTKYLHALGHPVLNSSGEVVQFMGTVTDITERKHAQEEHERLRQLESDFAHINRVSMMGELAASLSHEITQPIASARNNARAAVNFLDRHPPDLGEVREALDCVVGDTDRAGNIIERIRDHIKKEPPRSDSFDLNEAINEVVALARTEADNNGVSVQTHFAEGLSPVAGDRVQVQQVALNLVLNAVEAMSSADEGPRQLLIGTEQRQGGGVLVSVRDSGPGIDPEHLDRVFDAFYTTKSSGVGMGMGLSICRSIIDAHGGRLWADNSEPGGAVFQFTLPSAENDS